MSPEDTARLGAIRSKVLANPAYPSTPAEIEELRGAVAILRADRVSASHASTRSRTAKAEAAKPVNTADILAGLKAAGQKLASGPIEGA